MIPYLWLKAAHVAAVLIFIGGLFGQSFAVAAGRRGDGAVVALLSRWDGRATAPAMLIVWLTGAWLAAEGGWFGDGWLWAKLVLVVALTGLHGVQSGTLRRLRNGVGPAQDRRAITTVPAVALCVALVALLVVAKPF